MVAGDAVSYVVALVLFVAVARRLRVAVIEPAAEAATRTGSYRSALTDRGNITLALLNVSDTLLVTGPLLAMPVYVLNQLDLATWLPGVLAAIATAAVAVPLLVVAKIAHGQPRLRVLAVANLLWSLGCLLFASSAALLAAAPLILMLAMATIGVGEAAYAPTSDTLAVAIAPSGQTGRYTAIHQLAWGISGTLAPAVSGGATNPRALCHLVDLRRTSAGEQRRVRPPTTIPWTARWPDRSASCASGRQQRAVSGGTAAMTGVVDFSPTPR